MAALLADTCRVTSFPIQVYREKKGRFLYQLKLAKLNMADLYLTHLYEMIDHECGDTSSPPFRMHQQEGDVGLVVFHIRHHEAKTDDNFLIKHHHAEVWVLKAL